MKNHYYLAAALLVVALVLTGCFEEVTGPYDGPDQIAFGQVNGLYEAAVSDGAGTISLPTQLIGPQRSSEFEVNVSVLEEQAIRVRDVQTGDGSTVKDTTILALPTTADASNYTVPSSFVFPADSSNVPLNVEINDAGITESVRLTVRLDGNPNANIEPASNWRYFEITINPTP
jgi:hypothetical protein